MKTYLAVIGDANDPITWSGTPYHFLKAAQRVGLVDEGLRLCVAGGQRAVRRAAWNGFQLFRGRRYGGYQYQPCFLEKLFSPIRETIAGARVINCFQLFPPSVVRDDSVQKWFFIDMTLRQLFACYGASLDYRTAAEAIAHETEGFRKAEVIITHSAWAAKSVTDDYGISAERVRVVVPGANLDAAVYASWESNQPVSRLAVGDRPLRLVFVGQYWKRKGLDRLLDAFRLARARGADVTLRVIGLGRESAPASYSGVEGVEWCGFLHKRTDARTFLQLVAECDIGCLLSRAEAGGMVLREFHALGLVTLGPAVGGAPEHMIPRASIAVPVSATPADIADTILTICRDRPRFQEMRTAAWEARHSALWDQTCRRILESWPGQEGGSAGCGGDAIC